MCCPRGPLNPKKNERFFVAPKSLFPNAEVPPSENYARIAPAGSSRGPLPSRAPSFE